MRFLQAASAVLPKSAYLTEDDTTDDESSTSRASSSSSSSSASSSTPSKTPTPPEQPSSSSSSGEAKPHDNTDATNAGYSSVVKGDEAHRTYLVEAVDAADAFAPFAQKRAAERGDAFQQLHHHSLLPPSSYSMMSQQQKQQQHHSLLNVPPASSSSAVLSRRASVSSAVSLATAQSGPATPSTFVGLTIVAAAAAQSLPMLDDSKSAMVNNKNANRFQYDNKNSSSNLFLQGGGGDESDSYSDSTCRGGGDDDEAEDHHRPTNTDDGGTQGKESDADATADAAGDDDGPQAPISTVDVVTDNEDEDDGDSSRVDAAMESTMAGSDPHQTAPLAAAAAALTVEAITEVTVVSAPTAVRKDSNSNVDEYSPMVDAVEAECSDDHHHTQQQRHDEEDEEKEECAQDTQPSTADVPISAADATATTTDAAPSRPTATHSHSHVSALESIDAFLARMKAKAVPTTIPTSLSGEAYDREETLRREEEEAARELERVEREAAEASAAKSSFMSSPVSKQYSSLLRRLSTADEPPLPTVDDSVATAMDSPLLKKVMGDDDGGAVIDTRMRDVDAKTIGDERLSPSTSLTATEATTTTLMPATVLDTAAAAAAAAAAAIDSSSLNVYERAMLSTDDGAMPTKPPPPATLPLPSSPPSSPTVTPLSANRDRGGGGRGLGSTPTVLSSSTSAVVTETAPIPHTQQVSQRAEVPAAVVETQAPHLHTTALATRRRGGSTSGGGVFNNASSNTQQQHPDHYGHRHHNLSAMHAIASSSPPRTTRLSGPSTPTSLSPRRGGGGRFRGEEGGEGHTSSSPSGNTRNTSPLLSLSPTHQYRKGHDPRVDLVVLTSSVAVGLDGDNGDGVVNVSHSNAGDSGRDDREVAWAGGSSGSTRGSHQNTTRQQAYLLKEREDKRALVAASMASLQSMMNEKEAERERLASFNALNQIVGRRRRDEGNKASGSGINRGEKSYADQYTEDDDDEDDHYAATSDQNNIDDEEAALRELVALFHQQNGESDALSSVPHHTKAAGNTADGSTTSDPSTAAHSPTTLTLKKHLAAIVSSLAADNESKTGNRQGSPQRQQRVLNASSAPPPTSSASPPHPSPSSRRLQSPPSSRYARDSDSSRVVAVAETDASHPSPASTSSSPSRVLNRLAANGSLTPQIVDMVALNAIAHGKVKSDALKESVRRRALSASHYYRRANTVVEEKGKVSDVLLEKLLLLQREMMKGHFDEGDDDEEDEEARYEDDRLYNQYQHTNSHSSATPTPITTVEEAFDDYKLNVTNPQGSAIDFVARVRQGRGGNGHDGSVRSPPFKGYAYTPPIVSAARKRGGFGGEGGSAHGSSMGAAGSAPSYSSSFLSQPSFDGTAPQHNPHPHHPPPQLSADLLLQQRLDAFERMAMQTTTQQEEALREVYRIQHEQRIGGGGGEEERISGGAGAVLSAADVSVVPSFSAPLPLKSDYSVNSRYRNNNASGMPGTGSNSSTPRRGHVLSEEGYQEGYTVSPPRPTSVSSTLAFEQRNAPLPPTVTMIPSRYVTSTNTNTVSAVNDDTRSTDSAAQQHFLGRCIAYNIKAMREEMNGSKVSGGVGVAGRGAVTDEASTDIDKGSAAVDDATYKRATAAPLSQKADNHSKGEGVDDSKVGDDKVVWRSSASTARMVGRYAVKTPLPPPPPSSMEDEGRGVTRNGGRLFSSSLPSTYAAMSKVLREATPYSSSSSSLSADPSGLNRMDNNSHDHHSADQGATNTSSTTSSAKDRRSLYHRYLSTARELSAYRAVYGEEEGGGGGDASTAAQTRGTMTKRGDSGWATAGIRGAATATAAVNSGFNTDEDHYSNSIERSPPLNHSAIGPFLDDDEVYPSNYHQSSHYGGHMASVNAVNVVGGGARHQGQVSSGRAHNAIIGNTINTSASSHASPPLPLSTRQATSTQPKLPSRTPLPTSAPPDGASMLIDYIDL